MAAVTGEVEITRGIFQPQGPGFRQAAAGVGIAPQQGVRRSEDVFLLTLDEQDRTYFVPKEAAAVGMSYNQLCEEIVRLSCDVKRRG